MTTTEQISALHKRIALLELGLKSLEHRDIPLDKKITYTKSYLNKKYLNYEKIQNLIELEKADISVAKRDINLEKLKCKVDYQVAYTVTA